MVNDGWIKLYRKMLDWEWYTDTNCVRLFIHLLLKVNHEDAKWHGATIKRGSLITSLPSLSQQTKLTLQEVRTALTKLKSTGEITNHSTSKYRIITITSYNTYQTANRQPNSQATVKQQTSNRQPNTKQEEKNEKNEKNEKKGESTQPNFEKLSGELNISSPTVKRYFQKIVDYEQSTGKKYKNYEATIRSWIRRDIDEGKLKVSEHQEVSDSDKRIIESLERRKVGYV